jgi:hypothetical protein
MISIEKLSTIAERYKGITISVRDCDGSAREIVITGTMKNRSITCSFIQGAGHVILTEIDLHDFILGIYAILIKSGAGRKNVS